MADVAPCSTTSGPLSVNPAIEPICDSIYAINGLFTMMPGLIVPARMVVISLPSKPKGAANKLIVYSPFPPDLVDISSLGQVHCVIAPSAMHSCYAQQFHDAHPASTLYSTPILKSRFPERDWGTLLTSETPPDIFGPDLDFSIIDGFKTMQEIVLFHKPTQTIIAADLAFNLSEESLRGTPWLSQFLCRLMDTGQPLDWTYTMKMLFKSQCETALPQLNDIMVEWDFERFVPSHGAVCHRSAKEHFRNGVYKFVRETAERGKLESSGTSWRIMLFGAFVAFVIGNLIVRYQK